MKKFLLVFFVLFTLALTGCGSGNSEFAEVSVDYNISVEKWTVDPNDEKIYHHNEIDGVGLIIDEKHMGSGYAANYSSAGLGASSFADSMVEGYKLQGISCEVGEAFELNGTEWITLDVENDRGVKMHQNISMKGDGFYIVTYISMPEAYELGLPDFNEVMNGIEFTE